MFIAGVVWLFYYAILLLLGYFVFRMFRVRFTSRNIPRLVFLVVVLAGIIVDELPYLKWKVDCFYNEMRVYETAQVEGFSVNFSLPDSEVRNYLQSGYKFIEIDDMRGRGVYRYYMNEGSVERTHSNSPISKYRVERELFYESWAMVFKRRVVEVNGGRVLGESVDYGYAGGLVVQEIMKMFNGELHASAFCGKAKDDVVKAALNPKDK